MSVVEMTAAGKNGVRNVIALGTMRIDVTIAVMIATLLDTVTEALPTADGQVLPPLGVTVGHHQELLRGSSESRSKTYQVIWDGRS